LLLTAQGAQAQCSIPAGVISAAAAIDDSGRAAIDQCVNSAKEVFKHDDVKAVERARQDLLRPLIGSGAPSGVFRLAYDAALAPVLSPAAADKQDFKAINALVIAGEVAADSSLALLAKSLADERASVRMSAASGIDRTFQILAASPTGQSALSEVRAREAIKSLAARIGHETDPLVLLGCVDAMCAAANVPPDGEFKTLAADAISRMSAALADRASTKDAGIEHSLLQSSRAILAGLTKGQGAPPLDLQARTAIARFAGEGIAVVVRRVDAGAVNDANREMYADLAARCENILAFVNLPDFKPGTAKLGEVLGKGNDAVFRASAGNLLDELERKLGLAPGSLKRKTK
jgi:hypothetical protein